VKCGLHVVTAKTLTILGQFSPLLHKIETYYETLMVVVE